MITAPPLPPSQLCPVGTFTWSDANGDHSEEFRVLCPVPDDSVEDIEDYQSRHIRFAREDAYNLQYLAVVDFLSARGAHSITFTPYHPYPIF